MVRAWYYDNSNLDQRCPHLSDPPEFIDLDTLKDTTGVLYFKIDAENYKTDALLQRIRTERGYNYEDQITVTPEKLPNYEEKIKMFFEEHLHADEEIRLCIDGSGYFDARDKADRWVRIEMEKGDLIILPAGIYHRFTLDQKNFITANRYFVGEPVWTPVNRGPTADEHTARKTYLKDMGLTA